MPVTTAPTMSNAERQRRFRAAHPGYNNKYRGSRRKSIETLAAQRVVVLAVDAFQAPVFFEVEPDSLVGAPRSAAD